MYAFFKHREETIVNLQEFGWNSFFEQAFEPYAAHNLVPARIALQHTYSYRVFTEYGDFHADLSGNLKQESREMGIFPVTGDWVAVSILKGEQKAVIRGILRRKTLFSRKSAGNVCTEQPIAANIDTAFIITGLDGDFSIRRIERYLTLAYESGVVPVVVLNKTDLCEDIEAVVAKTEAAVFGVPVVPLNAKEQKGIERLKPFLRKGKTATLLGSSGVGKSTILNALVGKDVRKTAEVRQVDSKGRHTTTVRELFLLPDGGLIIDTPGMRELQLWCDEQSISTNFSDIEELALQCRFSDCKHEAEPDCAVKEALASGRLQPARFLNYQKMRREIAYLERRKDQSALLAEKARWKKINKEIRAFSKRTWQ